ncbi:hypothetical protein BC628DRAFT_458381 [Trametes gibbosa]|nr:hypothetical protein BC628DRAFT_458381 [Trametes gibbosa]
MPRVRSSPPPSLAMSSPPPRCPSVPSPSGETAAHGAETGEDWPRSGGGRRRLWFQAIWEIVRFVRGAGSFPRPTFHDAAVPSPSPSASLCLRPKGQNRNRLLPVLTFDRVPLHRPRLYILESMITRLDQTDLSLQKSATRPSAIVQSCAVRSASRLGTHRDPVRSQLSCDTRDRTERGRRGRRRVMRRIKCRPCAIKLVLAELWGLGVPGPKRNEGLWGKGGTSGDLPSSNCAAGATRVCDEGRARWCGGWRGTERGMGPGRNLFDTVRGVGAAAWLGEAAGRRGGGGRATSAVDDRCFQGGGAGET